MDTIRELFYGNIHPYERDILKGSECDKLNELIIRYDAVLKGTLNEHEAEILEKLKDALTELCCLYAGRIRKKLRNITKLLIKIY